MLHIRKKKITGAHDSRNGHARAMVAWVLLLLLMSIGITIWIVDNSALNWQAFDLPNGGVRVEMPGRPTLEKLPGSTVLYQAKIRDQVYGIGFLDLDPENNAWVTMTKGATDFAQATSGMVEVSRRNITLDGRDGLEVAAADTIGESVVARFVVVEGRMFIVAVSGGSITATHCDVARFFDSFRVTNPDPIGRAAARGATPTVELSNLELKAIRDELEMTRVDGEFDTWFQNVKRLEHPLPFLEEYPKIRLLFPFNVQSARDTSLKESVSGKLFGNLRKPVRAGYGVSGQGLAFPIAEHQLDMQGLDAFSAVNGKPFTLAIWFCAQDMAGNLFSLYPLHSSSNKESICLTLYKNNAKLDWPSGESMDVPVPADGQWHHFALSRTLLDGHEMLRIYVDGVEVRLIEKGLETDLSDLTGLKFGGGQFVGGLDEFSLFQPALSKEEIRKIAGVSVDRSTMDPKWINANALYLSMDGTRDGRLVDGSTGKPVGTMRGRTESTDGVRGSSIRFQGNEAKQSESLIDLSDIADRLPSEDGLAFSISFWIRPSSSATMLRNDEFELTVASADKIAKPQVRLTVLSQNSAHPGLTAPFLPEQDWCHVVLTRDSMGSVRLFVNGELVESDLVPNIRANTRSLVQSMLWCESPCDLDEVAVFSRVLSTKEALLLFGQQ